MYIDGIRLFAKKWKRIGDSNTNKKDIQSIGMEFGIKKCAILMKSGKRQITGGIELPSQDRIRMLSP